MGFSVPFFFRVKLFSFNSGTRATDAPHRVGRGISPKLARRGIGAELWRRAIGRWGICSEWATRFALRRQIRDLARQRAALIAHGAAVEEAFVTTGAALNEQTVLTGLLVEQGRRFETFTTASATGNPVRRAIAFVEQTLQTLDALQQECNGLIEGLRTQQHEIARLKTHAAMLDRAIAPLRILDTLFRIEAATLPAEMQTAFAALTHDIAELDGRVRQTFAKHFEALGVTSTAIAGVIRHLESDRLQYDHVATQQRAAMRETLVTLETNIARLRRQEEQIGAAVAEIDRDSNGIVIALQYQDITRQKLEHVVSALELVEQRVTAGSAGVSFVGHAARLQAGQLAAIQTDLSTAVRQIDAGLERIIDRLQQVEGSFSGGHHRADVAADARLIIDTIDAILPTLLQAVEAAAENGRAASRALQSYGGVAADIGATIGELTWGIRLIALNAQVQAAQIVRCDGLEVLARHTYTVSDETARLAETLGRDLARLNARLQAGVRQTQEFAEHTTAAREGFNASAEPVRRDLGRQREDVLGAVEEFGPLLRQTREHAARLVDRGELARIDLQSMAALQVELTRLATWCSDWRGDTDADVSARAAVDSLGSKYTMQSERAVHATVLNGSGDVAEPLEPSLAAHLANVPAGSGSPSAAIPGAGEFGGNVELF